MRRENLSEMSVRRQCMRFLAGLRIVVHSVELVDESGHLSVEFVGGSVVCPERVRRGNPTLRSSYVLRAQ